ncbi:MAG TPA: ATP synthase subunit I [Steroidobacteraceae bacterium]|nr:ATP synthase subunit I [Candidatus Dormibacteraeota bacterium]HYM27529.1 ATP synthase subunit I [Steroidobacteraceae bacterium]
MSAIDLPHARRLAFGVVLGQAVVTAIAGLVALAVAGGLAALSALAGGGIATAGSLAMAVLVFAGATGSAQRALGAFYVGEAAKLVVVVVLFVVALRVMRVAPLAMLAGFAVTYLMYWVALLGALPRLSGTGRSAL